MAQTSTDLNLYNIQFADRGTYYCIGNNSISPEVQSTPAELSVYGEVMYTLPFPAGLREGSQAL